MAQLVRRAVLELAPRDRWLDRLRRAAGVSCGRSPSPCPRTGRSPVPSMSSRRRSGGQRRTRRGPHRPVGRAGGGRPGAGDRRRVPLRPGPVPVEAGVRSPDPRAAQDDATPTSDLPGRRRPAAPPQVGGGSEVIRRAIVPLPDARPPVGARRDRCPHAPANELGVSFEERAVDTVVVYTDRYPYFIQEYGKVVWDRGRDRPSPRWKPSSLRRSSRPVWTRASSRCASSEPVNRRPSICGRWPNSVRRRRRAADVAQVLERPSGELGKVRTRLIEKGLLYSPMYGYAAFTVPQFDRFLRRAFPAPSSRAVR